MFYGRGPWTSLIKCMNISKQKLHFRDATTFSITTFSIMTLRINVSQHKDTELKHTWSLC
jgi:hypothetical protein